MANIHTPQGFRANFLSTQSGGRGPAFFNLNAPQPKANASEFLKIHDSSQPVKTLGKGENKVILYFSPSNKTAEEDAAQLKEITTDPGTLISEDEKVGDVVVRQLIRIKEKGTDKDGKDNATPLSGDNSYDTLATIGANAFFTAKKAASDQQKFFIDFVQSGSLTDPYMCTALLDSIKFPHNKKVFNEGETHAKSWVEGTFAKTLTTDDAKSALKSSSNFASNLAAMAATANKWYGPFHFINDAAGESNYEKSLVIFRGRDYLNTVKSLPRTKNVLSRFGAEITFEQLQTRLQYLRNKINEISNKSLIELKRGYMVLFPTMIGGATTEQFNNAEIFNNYFQDKLIDLKSRNKELSANSKDKIFKIIEEISDRENYLKSINDSIEVILKNHNYDTEEVNDLKAYQDLLEERNKVMNVLNRGNIKIADVFKTLDV